MNKKIFNKTERIYLRITQDEKKQIEFLKTKYKFSSVSDYLREVALNENIYIIDDKLLKNIEKNLARISSSVNQLAKKTHLNQTIYREDILEMNRKVEDIWLMLNVIQLNTHLKKL